MRRALKVSFVSALPENFEKCEKESCLVEYENRIGFFCLHYGK
jgi:hypothetical protein